MSVFKWPVPLLHLVIVNVSICSRVIWTSIGCNFCSNSLKQLRSEKKIEKFRFRWIKYFYVFCILYYDNQCQRWRFYKSLWSFVPNRENESNGEVFAFATFVIGDGGMLYELQIPLWNIYSWLINYCCLVWLVEHFAPLRLKSLTRIVFPFMIRACFVLSDKVANMAPVESAMLKFNSLLGHWNLRIWWCIPFLPIWWWYHLNVLKLWKFFPPWGLECFWSTLYQEIITIL